MNRLVQKGDETVSEKSAMKNFMFLSDLLSEEKDESKEKIILDELKMYIDEKFIPIIEKIQYGNKYTIVEELKKMISELEYYVKHLELIGNQHVAFYNPSVYVCKYIYKRYIKSNYSKQNVGFKKNMNCIFDQNKKLMNTFEVPTFIHGYDKKEGVYVESISQNKCQFNTEKHEQLLELSKKKNIDLKNLIYDISIYSENVPSKKVLSIIPESIEGKNDGLYNSIDKLWIQGKDIDMELLETMQNVSVVYVYNRISSKNKEFVEMYGKRNDIKIIFVEQLDKYLEEVLEENADDDSNNICYYYLMENQLMELSWFLAENKVKIQSPLNVINSDLVFNSDIEEMSEYLKKMKKKCDTELKTNDKIYDSYKKVADEILDKLRSFQNCFGIKEGAECINDHIKMETKIFDLIVKSNQVYKQYPESGCQQNVRDYCKIYQKVSQKNEAAKYLEYDYFKNDLSTNVNDIKKEVLNLNYNSQFYYHSVVKNSDALKLDLSQLHSFIEKMDYLNGSEQFLLAEYTYKINAEDAKKEYWASLYKGYREAGESLFSNCTLSDNEIKELADYGIASAAEKVGLDLYKVLKNQKINFAKEQWKECLRYLKIAATGKMKKALKTLGEIFFNCSWIKKDEIEYIIQEENAKMALYYYKLLDLHNSSDKIMYDRVAELLYGLERYSECVDWAEEKNTAVCNYLTGIIFEKGLGVAVDVMKALEYYEKATKQGHAEAAVAYERLNAAIEEQKKKEIVTDNTSYSSYTYYSSYYSYYSGDSSGCFVKGTKILLADSSTKNVEDIVIGDQVMIFDHFTGKISKEVIVANVHDSVQKRECSIITLKFENERVLELAVSHVLFDYTRNRYVMITPENVVNYIGDEFAYIENDSVKTTKLTEYSIQTKKVDYYAPLSKKHLNVIAEGFLTMPPTELTLGLFEMSKEKMVYCTTILEQTGITSYEKVKDYVSEDEYNELPCCYLEAILARTNSSIEIFEDVIKLYRKQKRYDV